MKKYLFGINTLLFTICMLNAQPPSQLWNPLSTFLTPSKERSLSQSDIIALKPNKRNQGWKDFLRSSAVEKMDSLVVPDREKGTFHYDENGYLSLFTYYYKLFAQDDLNPEFQQEYTFSPEGNLLEDIFSDWDNGDWILKHRDVYTYLANGNPNDQVTYLWDQITQTWVNSDRSVCAYLPDNKLEKKDYFYWDSGIQDWYNNERADYFYDANDRLKEIIFSSFNSIDNEWNPQTRLAYFYNTNNQVEVFLTSNWNGAWIPSGHTEYSYDAFGRVILETESWYDSTTKKWIPSFQNEYEYDAYGNMISNTFLPWDLLSSTFIPEDRLAFEYDINTLASDLYFPHLWEAIFIFNSKLTRIRIFEYEGGSWPEIFYGDFYYSPIITSIARPLKYDIRIFPNPASDYILVEMLQGNIQGELTLFNVAGQPLLQQKIHSEHTIIPIQYLPSGNYVIEVRNVNEEITRRSLFIR